MNMLCLMDTLILSPPRPKQSPSDITAAGQDSVLFLGWFEWVRSIPDFVKQFWPVFCFWESCVWWSHAFCACCFGWSVSTSLIMWYREYQHTPTYICYEPLLWDNPHTEVFRWDLKVPCSPKTAFMLIINVWKRAAGLVWSWRHFWFVLV